uniref:Uncharacterized protein n=1 Tax=Parascaris equorum TaxID=6256 RepID=A0A914SA91_PAREQ
MLGRRTSVEDHLVRDSKSMINGGWLAFALALLINYRMDSDKNALSNFLKLYFEKGGGPIRRINKVPFYQ